MRNSDPTPRPATARWLLLMAALATLGPAAAHAQTTPTPAAVVATAAAPAPALESPRMERLRATLAAGGSTQSFWRDVAASGGPLVEPGANAQEALVTFLWRGTPATRSVKVSWAMRTESGFVLTQLAHSDVWFLTLRLPAGLRAAYQMVPDATIPPGADRMARAKAEDAVARPDPLNRTPLWPQPPTHPAVSAERTAPRSVLRLPGALQEPWAAADVAPAVPRGTLEHTRLASTLLANERDISIYLPAQASRSTTAALPLLVLFDREAYLDRVDMPAVLDALIAQRHIPPLAAVLVSNPTRALRATELPAHPAFADFLALELMPWLRTRHPQLSPHARDVVVAGSSYGGLASAWAGFRHPQTFGNVLALSGSFWWGPGNVQYQPDFNRFGEGEWLTREFAASARLPLRFFMTAGLMEHALTGDGGGILETSRHLRTVLQAKGYPVHYQEFAGGHDYYAWRGELAQGLVVLLGEQATAQK